MTMSRGLFVQQNGQLGTTPVEARRALAGLLAQYPVGTVRSGVLTRTPGLQLVTATASTAPLQYQLAACEIVIGRSSSEGGYIVSAQGTTTIPTGAAPAAGLSRYDLIYVKQNDPEKSDGDNLVVLGVAQGTPSASPARPTASVPAGAYVLAEARIYSGTTATNGTPNTIAQLWRYTALAGEPIPVRDLTERAELAAPTTGTKVLRLDLPPNEAVETWNGTIWDSPMRFVEYAHTWNVPGGQSWDGGPLAVVANTARGDQSFHNRNGAVNGAVNIAESGLYALSSTVLGSSSPGSAYAAMRLNGQIAATGPTDGKSWEMTPTHVAYLAAGTEVRIALLFTNAVNNVKTQLKIAKLL